MTLDLSLLKTSSLLSGEPTPSWFSFHLCLSFPTASAFSWSRDVVVPQGCSWILLSLPAPSPEVILCFPWPLIPSTHSTPTVDTQPSPWLSLGIMPSDYHIVSPFLCLMGKFPISKLKFKSFPSQLAYNLNLIDNLSIQQVIQPESVTLDSLSLHTCKLLASPINFISKNTSWIHQFFLAPLSPSQSGSPSPEPLQYASNWPCFHPVHHPITTENLTQIVSLLFLNSIIISENCYCGYKPYMLWPVFLQPHPVPLPLFSLSLIHTDFVLQSSRLYVPRSSHVCSSVWSFLNSCHSSGFSLNAFAFSF